jgi:hypothetical protein
MRELLAAAEQGSAVYDTRAAAAPAAEQGSAVYDTCVAAAPAAEQGSAVYDTRAAAAPAAEQESAVYDTRAAAAPAADEWWQRPRRHRVQLRVLQLDGPVADAGDDALLRLITPVSPCNNPQPLSLPACIDAGAPLEPWALTALCLVRVSGVSDALLHALSGCALQHVRLEECRTAHSRDGSGSRQAVGAPPAAFSEEGMRTLLTGRCGISLRSLQLRHAAAPLGEGFVAAAVRAAPLLQRLVLDACDLQLQAGAAGPELLDALPHGALRTLHVVNCCSAGPGTSVRDASLLVVLPQLERHVLLPP